MAGVKNNPSDYGCEILLEKTTLEKASDVNYPTDAYIVRYKVDDKDLIDLTRTGKLTSLFDMYYDNHGKNVIQKIEFGRGNRDPKMWGIKTPPKKKRLKG